MQEPSKFINKPKTKSSSLFELPPQHQFIQISQTYLKETQSSLTFEEGPTTNGLDISARGQKIYTHPVTVRKPYLF